MTNGRDQADERAEAGNPQIAEAPEVFKDSRTRSLLKGLTWRVVATTTTILIAWAITGDTRLALEIGAVEVVAKIFVYYAHERIWQLLPHNLKLGGH